MHNQDIWKKFTLTPEATIREALEAINQGYQFALVTDKDERLLGVVTDGNVRRGLLNGMGLDAPVTAVMNVSPCVVHDNTDMQTVLSLMQEKDFSHIPVLDASDRLVRVWSRRELVATTVLSNPVVLMAGGLGTRMGELTKDCPKPMLPVGGRPILEIVLQNLKESGFRNIFLAVNYQAEKIEKHFGNGETFGLHIDYLREEKRLGTAGALSLLPEKPDMPVVVMNSDILTRLNIRLLLQQHNARGALATMVVIDHKIQLPYGVVDSLPDGRLSDIREKPTATFPVSAGINVLDPEAWDYIPSDEFLDMPDLLRTMLSDNKKIQVYHTDEYWLDIGRMDDYSKADADFFDVFCDRHAW